MSLANLTHTNASDGLTIAALMQADFAAVHYTKVKEKKPRAKTIQEKLQTINQTESLLKRA